MTLERLKKRAETTTKTLKVLDDAKKLAINGILKEASKVKSEAYLKVAEQNAIIEESKKILDKFGS